MENMNVGNWQAGFRKDLQLLNTKYAGAYLLNKFFIKVKTNRNVKDLPSYDPVNRTISDDDQLILQRENFVTLYHEYIHYIHEISTMCGITQFYMEVICRAIFSGFVDVPAASTSQPITGINEPMYQSICDTTDAIFGGSVADLEGQIVYNIGSIILENFDAYAPFHAPSNYTIKVPEISYEFAEPANNYRGITTVYFGKFYLYEGLAHHLDQLVSLKLHIPLIPKHQVKPEYKIMEQVAQFIFPEIDERTMLEIASLSLSYWNCGYMFIHMITEAASVENLSGYIMEQKNKVHESLSERKDDLLYTLDQIKQTFSKRDALHQVANHLCNEMALAFDQRIANPTFEVDVTYSGRFETMADYVKHCDLLYEFNDKDDYMRDFAGTYQNNSVAVDQKTFLSHVDYYQTEMGNIKSHCCPLYTFCPHKRRQEKAQQCRLQPRRAYESHQEYGWCNYGLGVAYMKGEDR